ncbi:MAG: LysE family translocator [Pseudomonadota bacterium]
MPDFVPDPPLFLAYLAATFVIIFTPGPDMTLFLGKTLAQGRAQGLASMFGAATGNLVHTVLAAVGLSALLAANDTAFRIIQIAGALYLLWLAVQSIRHGSALTVDRAAQAPEPVLSAYLQGIGINLLNPKVVIFFLTFLPQFVVPGDPAAIQTLLFLGVLLVVLAVMACIPMILFADWIAHAARRSKGVMRSIDWLFAGIMGGFALKLLLDRR